MLTSKTPLRVSFLGGGTDYPSYFDKNPGSVLGGTINQYVYTSVIPMSKISDQKFRLTYRTVDNANVIDDIKHPVVREVLRWQGIDQGLNISTMSDLPGSSGLGSSSSFTVGFINLINEFKSTKMTKRQLAENAVYLERTILKENVGVQDQYHAAFGGLNRYKFHKNKVEITPVNIHPDILKQLNDSMYLVYTGVLRHASQVSASQEQKTKQGINHNYLEKMHNMTLQGLDILESQSLNFKEIMKDFGELLKQGWELKKSIGDNITNEKIDEIFQQGMDIGAYGGKLLGAGSGGFILFLGNHDFYKRLTERFQINNIIRINFTEKGSEVFGCGGNI